MAIFEEQRICIKRSPTNLTEELSSVTGLSVYLGIMRCLREAVRLKRPERWQNNDWILHVGNARPHTVHVVLQFLAKHSTIQIPHPPYSPDLAPNDFFLYPKLKINLKGRKFDNVDMIQAESKATLRNLSKRLAGRDRPEAAGTPGGVGQKKAPNGGGNTSDEKRVRRGKASSSCHRVERSIRNITCKLCAICAKQSPRNAPDLWKNKNWLLHHDNAPAHTSLSLLVRDFLAKNNTLMMPQPPYSPDLAPYGTRSYRTCKNCPGVELTPTHIFSCPEMAVALQKIDMDPEQQLYTPKIVDIAASVIEMHGDI
ncbi:hypothetical protein LAZ67_2004636 [Cordylochernes scorpioides]|uniref:Transposase n=1 Tax=Cordylochernes scorpioides TaxID=51811 RepID=A0ABY6K3V6_9ARAC|nr:hypothetical protein LAZ67_2004636 [Cordylochernes scorpioides]